MKAALHTAYGPPDLLEVVEVEKPVPKQRQVLIKIRATTVSSGDCNVRNLTFVPKSFAPLARLMFGIRKPWRKRILGTQLAGEVEAVGHTVTRFKAGDGVFASTGMAGGGHAQYACLSENGSLAIKPARLSWEEAVAIPFGANTALYYLQDLGKIHAGHKILIIGASGSIGTAAVQLARHFGANVTAVCSGQNAGLVQSLGADDVIDYTREDFTKNTTTYDLILDAVAATTFSRCRQSLTPEGIFLPCIMGLTDMLFRMPWTSMTGGQKAQGRRGDRQPGKNEHHHGTRRSRHARPVIDRRYPLEQIAEAFEYVERGHKKGNVVITVEHP